MGRPLRITQRRLRNRPGDAKYSVGGVVSDVIITAHGARWALEVSGQPCGEHVIV